MCIKNKINFFSNKYNISEDIVRSELDLIIIDIQKRIRLNNNPEKWSLVEIMLVESKLKEKLKELVSSNTTIDNVKKKSIYSQW